MNMPLRLRAAGDSALKSKLTDYTPITPYGEMHVIANYTIWRKKKWQS